MRVSESRDRLGSVALSALVLTLVSPIAFGHPGHAPADSVFAGLSHIVGGLDHLLFYVAVGVFASRRQFASVVKSIAVASGLVLAVVHLAPVVTAMSGAFVIASVIMTVGFGLGRCFDRLIANRSAN